MPGPREMQWAQRRMVDPALSMAITAVEQFTRTVGRQNVPDNVLLLLAGNMERVLGAQQFILRNPQGFFNAVRNGADLNGDGWMGGVADAEVALRMNA